MFSSRGSGREVWTPYTRAVGGLVGSAVGALFIGVGYAGITVGIAAAIEKGTVSGGNGTPSAGVAETD
ncbi:hypothetical protein V5735_10950 (plasmid) [Haladaptatus sp. SPP-AMP-3]|uniref:hypothetical protein n=1 Tax=Haladaptatus sp. SPP-AMP-3 TaxID=3121295 RepID=UPI003C2B93EE